MPFEHEFYGFMIVDVVLQGFQTGISRLPEFIGDKIILGLGNKVNHVFFNIASPNHKPHQLGAQLASLTTRD